MWRSLRLPWGVDGGRMASALGSEEMVASALGEGEEKEMAGLSPFFEDCWG